MTLDIFYEKLSVLGERLQHQEFASFVNYTNSKMPKSIGQIINSSDEGFQSFYFAMYLQHLKIKMPDITPTNFGLSVLTIQVDAAIDIYILSLKNN